MLIKICVHHCRPYLTSLVRSDSAPYFRCHICHPCKLRRLIQSLRREQCTVDALADGAQFILLHLPYFLSNSVPYCRMSISDSQTEKRSLRLELGQKKSFKLKLAPPGPQSWGLWYVCWQYPCPCGVHLQTQGRKGGKVEAARVIHTKHKEIYLHYESSVQIVQSHIRSILTQVNLGHFPWVSFSDQFPRLSNRDWLICVTLHSRKDLSKMSYLF